MLMLSAGCSGSGTKPSAPAENNQPLSAFQQDVTSQVDRLRLRPSETVKIPVVVKNPGQETWASRGKAPVTVSYKWFDRGSMLLIEGERTLLPRAVSPGEAVPLDVKVVAPPQGGRFALRITLVQEGVAWFMIKGGKPLEIPVDVE
jgi:hypothetical protein